MIALSLCGCDAAFCGLLLSGVRFEPGSFDGRWVTLNEELKSKSDELESTASALSNIKESLDFPLLVVDMNVNVLQFNSAAKALCNEAEQLRMGAALMRLDFKVPVIDLLPMIKDVMAAISVRPSAVTRE